MGCILIVDDEVGIRTLLEVILRRDGHTVASTADGSAAIAHLASHPQTDLVLTDLRMEPMDGIALLRAIRSQTRGPFTLMMTAFAEWDTAVAAMQLGAYDLLRKPFDNSAVRALVRRALAARDRWLTARDRQRHRSDPPTIIGSSPRMVEIQDLIIQVATTEASVLLAGEAGTGKDLVAEAIHDAGLRSDRALVRADLGGIPVERTEEALFGGPGQDAPGSEGLIAKADGGTLLLDGIEQLPLEVQGRLLRVLESGERFPPGAREPVPCDLRLIAATGGDLHRAVREGAFREDLRQRISTIQISLPPLRERQQDIPLLAGHLLARHAVRLRRGVSGFTQEALAALGDHLWPGNVRELDAAIERGVTLTASGPVPVEHLFERLATPPPATDSGATALRMRLEAGQAIDLESEITAFERELMETALRRSGNNLTEAAKLLGISFRQIRYKVRQLGLR